MILRLKSRAAARDEARQSLMQAVRVRHRAPGHVRFDLPAALCAPDAAAAVERGLRQVEGVYRVTLFTGAGKLSIRWAEEVCSLAAVVRRLAAIVGDFADGAAVPATAAPSPGLWARLKAAAPVVRLRARYDELKAKAAVLNQIMALKTGGKVALPVDAKDWVMHFANDLVVYYLIRIHWDRI